MARVEASVSGWRKSSRCDSNACVEVAWQGRVVAVRDNTLPGTHLTFDAATWHHLLNDLRRGRLAR